MAFYWITDIPTVVVWYSSDVWLTICWKYRRATLLILTMRICEGRPDGPCPDRRIDNTVRGSQGDLMLCRNCELYRFPYLAKPATNYGAVESDSSGHAAASTKISLSAATASSSEKISAESAKPLCAMCLVLCDVLCFVSSKYDNFSRSVIKDTMTDFMEKRNYCWKTVFDKLLLLLLLLLLLWKQRLYTVSQKMHQLRNGIAKNYKDQFRCDLAEILKSL